jgi:hypothetical protein
MAMDLMRSYRQSDGVDAPLVAGEALEAMRVFTGLLNGLVEYRHSEKCASNHASR